MGRALRDGYRKRAFLMTKIDGRTRKAAAQQIEQSLQALETDVIDLLQIHEVIRTTDPDRVFGPDGAMEALVAARKAGKIRFIGFTGHKSPDIHLKMLDTAARHGFAFDTVQMPVNVMDAHYDSFGARVLPAATAAGIGVLGMKPLGAGLFFKSEPLARGTVTPTECLQYAMSLPTSVVITGCESLGVLMQGLDAAYRFHPDVGRRARRLCSPAPSPRHARESGNATRSARTSTGRYATPRGWRRPRAASGGVRRPSRRLDGRRRHHPGVALPPAGRDAAPERHRGTREQEPPRGGRDYPASRHQGGRRHRGRAAAPAAAV